MDNANEHPDYSQPLSKLVHIDKLCDGFEHAIQDAIRNSTPWPNIEDHLGDSAEPLRSELRQEFLAVEASYRQSTRNRKPGVQGSPGEENDMTRPAADDLPANFLKPSDRPGSLGRLGSYEVLEIVGRGGMGIVFRALDSVLQRVVAIKVLAPVLAASGVARQRFLREGRAAAAVAHDHVVTIHGVDESDSVPYLVMHFVAGMSLQERLRQSGALPTREVLRIGLQTAQGLAAAHAQGLVHRDVKPANILLENGVERVKLTDFGLARASEDPQLTQAGCLAGTPRYMSPEQAEGAQVDARSDLFSLGSVLYEMATGCAAFSGQTSTAVLRAVAEAKPKPVRQVNPEVPEGLAEVIARLMARDPAARYQTADEVAEVLGRMLAEIQQASSVKPPQRRILLRAPRRIIALAVLLVAVLGAGILAWQAGAKAWFWPVLPEKPAPVPPPAVPGAWSPEQQEVDDKKAKERQEACAEQWGVPVEIANSVGMKLVLIPSGEFLMGSTRQSIEEELQLHGSHEWIVPRLPAEMPQHQVRITKPYRLGVTEVTQEEYQRVIGSNPSKFQGDPKRPVEQVSWHEAMEFCRRLSELPEEKAAGRRYVLPTEAQWEYACRAGSSVALQSAAKPLARATEESVLGAYGWFWANKEGQTHAVGQKRANAFGLYDMYGNVGEWCADWYAPDYYANSPADDPVGPATGSNRVCRGGSWFHHAYGCRLTFRHHDVPETKDHTAGFRVVQVPVEK